MEPRTEKQHFLQVIEAHGQMLAWLTPADGVDLMLAFYQVERADGCKLDQDGDMLLFQWGCCDWGEGASFELNSTRQFIERDGEDEEIRQLHLTFKFKPTESLRKLGEGNRWCHSPKDLEGFRSFLDAAPALTSVARAKPAEVVLEMELAG